MSSEVKAPREPSDAVAGSRTDSGKAEETFKQKAAIAVLGALGALGVAWAAGEYTMASTERTGAYLLRNSENEFLREQRISAYGAYIEDLLTLEQKYRTAADLLKPTGTAAHVQASGSVEGATAAQKASKLIGELEVAMNDITQAKSVVDVLGPEAVAEAGQTAIDCYGPLKGQMQYHLSEWSQTADMPAAKPTYEEALARMQTRGREPFTNEARTSLRTLEVVGNTAEATASTTAGAQPSPVASPAKTCLDE